MRGWHVKKASKEKSCPACGTKYFPTGPAQKSCSIKCANEKRKQLGVGDTKSQYKRISGNWRRYFSRLINTKNANRKNLSVENLLSILERQNFQCALSGEVLTCNLESGTVFRTNASIDRIVAGGEYTVENVQLVCSAINKWRGDISIDDYIFWCRKVVEMADKKRNFAKEYRDYHGTPEQIQRRSERNKARSEAMADGKVKKGDGKEVDHVNAPRTGSLDGVPTRVISKTANRKRQPKRT